MIGAIGTIAMLLAGLGAALAASTPLGTPIRAARAGIDVAAAGLTIAIAALGWALLTDDFRLAYIVAHSEHTLAPSLKLAALWSGQEGSLLLWAWLGSVAAAIAARKLGSYTPRATLALLGLSSAALIALVLLAANPFAAAPEAALEGRGLHPLLQHWAMVAHPPAVLSAYAGFIVPLAILLGAIIDGHLTREAIHTARLWAIGSWTLLTIGIALGAWWSYIQLGWGGYWAWDPVENASLMPWLAGLALVHTLRVVESRGTLKHWAAWLALFTCSLCIFGTFLTRSGVVQSVHAFGPSGVGAGFIAYLLATIALSTFIIVRYRRAVCTDAAASPSTRDTITSIANLVLVLMTIATLVGTVLPLISAAISGREVSVSALFYARTVLPLALVLLALMAIAPLTVAHPAQRVSTRTLLAIAAVAASASALIALSVGLTSLLGLAAIAIAAAALSMILTLLASSTRALARATHRGFISSTFHSLTHQHRRFGAALAHTGMALAVIGIASSTALSTSRTFTLKPGQRLSAAGQSWSLASVTQRTTPGFDAIEATLTPDDTNAAPLTPQRRVYRRSLESLAHVATYTTLTGGLYIALMGWEDGGAAAVLEVQEHPGIAWVWIGASLVIIGAGTSMLPRVRPAAIISTHPTTPATPTTQWSPQ